MSPHAVILQLNSCIKERLVREVQIIKTESAIYSTSDLAQESFYDRMEELKNIYYRKAPVKLKIPKILRPIKSLVSPAHFPSLMRLKLRMPKSQHKLYPGL